MCAVHHRVAVRPQQDRRAAAEPVVGLAVRGHGEVHLLLAALLHREAHGEVVELVLGVPVDAPGDLGVEHLVAVGADQEARAALDASLALPVRAPPSVMRGGVLRAA